MRPGRPPSLKHCCRLPCLNRIEISALARTRKKFAGLAGHPVGQQTYPFTASRIDATQPDDQEFRKHRQTAASGGPPIHRIRLDIETDLSKNPDRPWHV